jgi:hypothetical protein
MLVAGIIGLLEEKEMRMDMGHVRHGFHDPGAERLVAENVGEQKQHFPLSELHRTPRVPGGFDGAHQSGYRPFFCGFRMPLAEIRPLRTAII